MKRKGKFVGFVFLVIVCVWGVFLPTTMEAAPETTADPSWTIYFRPGVRFGTDNRTLFMMDFLVPLYRGDKDIIFFNPKLTPDDQDGLEVNLGIGYRRLLLDDRVILGGNVFYDNRRTGWGTRWEQIGLGVEAMAEFNKYVALTGRFNYYIPLTDPMVSGTGGPATGHYFRTGGIWTGGGGSIEESPEGFDGELGVRIPVVSDYVETWVYGGGYHYNGKHVGTIDGWTARLEVIPTDFLRLSYDYRDDNTSRHGEHHGEVSFEVPFSIENLIAGRNPFEGLGRRLSGSRDMKERLTEPVRRDPDIRVVHGGSGGGVSELVEGVVFVSETAASGTGDGSFESPFASISEAVAAIHSGGVYAGITTIHVMADGGDYAGGGTADIANLMIWGSGMPHPTYGHIQNQYTGNPEIYMLSIYADNVEVFGSTFVDSCGIYVMGHANIHDNEFAGNYYGIEVAGDCSPTITGNTFTGNNRGVYTHAGTSTITDNTFTGNTYGVYNNTGTFTITGSTFTDNNCGIYAYGGTSTITGNNTFTGGVGGVVTVGGTPTITGNTFTGSSYGVRSDGGTVTITDNLIGTDANPITDTGILLTGGIVFGEISGNDITVHGSGTAYGIRSDLANLVLSDNDITVTSDSSTAYGIYSYRTGDITGSITGGTITATGGQAEGIYLEAGTSGSGSIGGSTDNPFSISGVEIDVEGTSNNSSDCGIHLRAYDNVYAAIDLDGSNISITSNSGYAHGIVESAVHGSVYGSITDTYLYGATDDHAAINADGYYIIEGISLDSEYGSIGDSSHPFSISGITINADGDDTAYAIYLNASDDIYAAISNATITATADDSTGYGYGIWMRTARIIADITENDATITAGMSRYFMRLYSTAGLGTSDIDWSSNTYERYGGAWSGNYGETGFISEGPLYLYNITDSEITPP